MDELATLCANPYADGFKVLGQFLQAVAESDDDLRRADPRLEWQPGGFEYRAGPVGLNEALPSEGGFLVGAEQTTSLWERTLDTGQIISLCTGWLVSRATMRVPMIDESSRVDGSRFGGISMDFCELCWPLPRNEIRAALDVPLRRNSRWAHGGYETRTSFP